MTRTCMLSAMLVLAAAPLAAQRPTVDDDSIPVLGHRTLSGPRLGLVMIGGSVAKQRLAEEGLNPVMSVFGWHFEQLIRPQGGGPMFVTQEVLAIAGVDQGVWLPSATLLFGIRTPQGFEFGMGPNLSPFGTALAIGVGKSLNYGGVTIPLNLALVRSQGVARVTFMAGYAIRRS